MSETMTKTVQEEAVAILEEAIRGFTNGPEAGGVEWCQETLSMNVDGKWADPVAAHACCGLGGLCRVVGIRGFSWDAMSGLDASRRNGMILAVIAASDQCRPKEADETISAPLTSFNDEWAKSEEDVIAKFEKAIDRLNDGEYDDFTPDPLHSHVIY